MRWVAMVLAGCVLTTGLLGAVDTLAYSGRAQDLEARWRAMAAEGISNAELASLRDEMAALNRRRIFYIPYAVISGAAVVNPLSQVEAETDAVYAMHLAAARDAASAALTDLLAEDTFSLPLYRSGHAAIASATSLTALSAMEQDWQLRAVEAVNVRAQLGQAAGGWQDARPADVAGLLAQVKDLTDKLGAAKVSTVPGAGVAATVDTYYLEPVQDQLTGHSALMATLRWAVATLQERLDTKAAADSMVAQAGQLVQIFQAMGGDVQQVAADVTGATQAVATAQTTAELTAGRDRAQAIVNRLGQLLNAPFSAITYTACVQDAPSKLIIIHTISEVMVAYNGGCPWLQTLVTTGRPGLRTDLGVFHILAKYSPYLFISPWPYGDPNYYPPTWVSYAMPFVSDGTFLHDSPWQPLGTYGPGSQDGWYASHGCIHIQPPVMPIMYRWAEVGTEVRTYAD